MKREFIIIIFLSVLFQVRSQNTSDAAVQINAIAQSNPPQITLNWVGNNTTMQYNVYRKLKSASFWGNALTSLTGSINTYVDNTAQVGDNYEYRVTRTGTNYSGYGYINSGIEVPEIEFRGKLILLVDSSMMSFIAPEIDRYINDVEGDGWEVIRHDVLRTATVLHVKDLILADYAIDTTDIKAVFIIGHVPVPYSGNINPDGHGDHLGAWPADVYYGDIDGVWTDLFVTSTTASPARTQNIPGDGKFDQSLVPGDVELQVGRADFASLPSFTITEQQLLKNYLDKDHDYRKKIFVPLKQGVIDDNFGYFSGEAFAASGYKNLAPMVGTASITSADYITSMSAASYQWSYGCGGGYYQGASGIGNTGNLANSNLKGVFTMLFGSYFGDWDTQDNFLRAPLAQGKVLTNVWSGRPHYQFHHMALGENIGYGLLVTQNNPGGAYFASPTGITGKWIHNALMGDPTLRNDVVSAVANVVATKVGNDCFISWSPSPQSNILGYNIYMKNDSNTRYTKINQLPVTSTTYTDYCLLYKGIYSYMVRALYLETTPSGTYYNMSEGLSDTAYSSTSVIIASAFTGTLNVVTLSLTNTSINSINSNWDFGDGNTSTQTSPVHTYTSNGFFYVTLISSNPCFTDTIFQTFTIVEVGIDQFGTLSKLQMFPNPTESTVHFTGTNSKMNYALFDAQGRTLKTGNLSSGFLDLSVYDRGFYYIRITDGGLTKSFRVLKD